MENKAKTLTIAGASALTFTLGAVYASENVPTVSSGLDILGGITVNEAALLSNTQMEEVQGQAKYRPMGQRKYGVSNRFGQHRKPRNFRGSHSRYKNKKR